MARQVFPGAALGYVTQSTVMLDEEFASCVAAQRRYIKHEYQQQQPAAVLTTARVDIWDQNDGVILSSLQASDSFAAWPAEEHGLWTVQPLNTASVGGEWFGALVLSLKLFAPSLVSFNATTGARTTCNVSWPLVLAVQHAPYTFELSKQFFLEQFAPCLPSSLLRGGAVQLPWRDYSLATETMITFSASSPEILNFTAPFETIGSGLPAPMLVEPGFFASSDFLQLNIANDYSHLVFRFRRNSSSSVVKTCVCNLLLLVTTNTSVSSQSCSGDSELGSFWAFDEAAFSEVRSCLVGCGCAGAAAWTAAGSGVFSHESLTGGASLTAASPDTKATPPPWLETNHIWFGAQPVVAPNATGNGVTVCSFFSSGDDSISGGWVNASDPSAVVHHLCVPGPNGTVSASLAIHADYSGVATIFSTSTGTTTTRFAVDDLSTAAAVARALSVFGADTPLVQCGAAVQQVDSGYYCVDGEFGDLFGLDLQQGNKSSTFAIKTNGIDGVSRVSLGHWRNSFSFTATINPNLERRNNKNLLLFFRALFYAATAAGQGADAWAMTSNSTVHVSFATAAQRTTAILLTLRTKNAQRSESTVLLRHSPRPCFEMQVCGADSSSSNTTIGTSDAHDGVSQVRGVFLTLNSLPEHESYFLVDEPVSLAWMLAEQQHQQNSTIVADRNRHLCDDTKCGLPCTVALPSSSSSPASLFCSSLFNQTIFSFLVKSLLLRDPVGAVALVQNATLEAAASASHQQQHCASEMSAALRMTQSARFQFECVEGSGLRWWLLPSSSNNSDTSKTDRPFEISALAQYQQLLGIADLRCTSCAPFLGQPGNVAQPISFLAVSALKTLLLIFVVNILRTRFEPQIDRALSSCTSRLSNAMLVAKWQRARMEKLRAAHAEYLVAPMMSVAEVMQRLEGFLLLVQSDVEEEERGEQSQKRLYSPVVSSARAADDGDDDDDAAPLRSQPILNDDDDNNNENSPEQLESFALVFSVHACCNGERLPRPAAEWGQEQLDEHAHLLTALQRAVVVRGRSNNNNDDDEPDVKTRSSPAPSALEMENSQHALLMSQPPSAALHEQDNCIVEEDEKKQQQNDGSSTAAAETSTNPAAKTFEEALAEYNEWAAREEHESLFERVRIDVVVRRARLIPIPFFLALDLLYATVSFIAAAVDAANEIHSSAWMRYQSFFFKIMNSTIFSSLLINIFGRLAFHGGWKNASRFDKLVVAAAAAFLLPGYFTHCVPAILAYCWFYLLLVLPMLLLRWYTSRRPNAALWVLALTRVAFLFVAAVTLSSSYNIALSFVYGEGTPLAVTDGGGGGGGGGAQRPGYLDALRLDFEWRAVECSLSRFESAVSNKLQILASIGPTP